MVLADMMMMTMGLEVEKVRENNRMLCFVHIATRSGDGETGDEGCGRTAMLIFMDYDHSHGENNSLPHTKKYLRVR